jgi:acetyltransferase-like isoleucine patch superfamily enzyme
MKMFGEKKMIYSKILFYFSKFIKKISIPSIKKSEIGLKSKIFSHTMVYYSKIGRYSYIGNYCTVINCEIGNFVSIADNTIIGGASHPINWLSTSPVFYRGKNSLHTNFSRHNYYSENTTQIGSDVWIGNNVLIKAGVKIGNGSVIGMGSVVTKDIGDYEIWAGNPAKIIRERFDKDIVRKLSSIKWWEFNDNKLRELAKYSNDVEKIVAIYKSDGEVL